MSLEDKLKWNKKYKDKPKLLENRDPSKKLLKALELCLGKKALEVACGNGRNSIYIAKNGFEVDALDISEVAIDELNKKFFKNINTKVIDLDEYLPPKNTYDLIIKTNFLDRKLIPYLCKALKKDGILFIETYMQHEENEKKDSNPDYLLKKEELKSFFNDEFEIIDYDEFLNESYEMYKMMKQSICVKKLI